MRILKPALIAALAGIALFGQANQTVAISKGTPDTAITSLFFYDGSNNLQYVCKARQPFATFTWAVTPSVAAGQGTLTSIVVSSNVGTVTTSGNHGLAVNNRVVVAGSTTSALNGSYVIQTVGAATTFTITTSGVADGTYNTAALTVSTTAPRSSTAIWSVEKLTYNVGNFLIADQYAAGSTSGSGATTAYSFICDNRATLAYQ